MSFNVPATFQTKYRNNVEMTLQQQRSMLLDAVMVQDDASAEKIKITNFVGHAKTTKADERHGDTKYANTPHDGIWLAKPPEEYFAELVDNADQLATSIELEGIYVRAGAQAVNRGIDKNILEGMFGSIVSGKDGTTVTPFPSSMIVPVTTGGASGAQRMNVQKLRAANKLLAQNYVDLAEPRYMILSAEQSDDLLSEVPATSADFTGAFGGRVMDGFIRSLLGWTFIPMELSNPFLDTIPALALDGSGYRKNPFWVKSGVVANFWQRLRTSIDKVPTKVVSTQVFAGTTVAATRTQAGKVGIILNSEA
jgi:hypothetical protein